MSDLVGNPEDRFSHNEAHFIISLYLFVSVLFVESACNQKVSEAVERYEECLLFMFKQSLPIIQTILDDHGTDLGVRTEGRKFVYYYAKLPQLQYVP